MNGQIVNEGRESFMEGSVVFERAFGIIKEHKLLMAAAAILAVLNTLSDVLCKQNLLGEVIMLLLMQPLQFGGLYMALKAWRNEPLAWDQLVHCYVGGRLGRSALYALAYCGAALLAGLAIGVGVMLSAFFGILAPFGMLAAVFFGLAVLGIFIYPMVLAYLDQEELSVSEAYSRGRSLTEGKFKPLLGIAWGIFWRVGLVGALPEILVVSLGADLPVSVVIQTVLGWGVLLYTNVMITGVWQELLPKEQASGVKDGEVVSSEGLL